MSVINKSLIKNKIQARNLIAPPPVKKFLPLSSYIKTYSIYLEQSNGLKVKK